MHWKKKNKLKDTLTPTCKVTKVFFYYSLCFSYLANAALTHYRCSPLQIKIVIAVYKLNDCAAVFDSSVRERGNAVSLKVKDARESKKSCGFIYCVHDLVSLNDCRICPDVQWKSSLRRFALSRLMPRLSYWAMRRSLHIAEST